MQVYRGMCIGTAVIPEEERLGVPHHLLEIADPREEFHAARFVEEARAAAEHEWQEHGRRSLVVGGTGMWIEALREGLFPGPGRDARLREELHQRITGEGPESLHRELARMDPATAARISPRDRARIVRALEVYRLSGKPLSQWYQEDRHRRAALGPLPPLVVLRVPKEQLRGRIERRVDGMLAAGWLEEARRLRALGLPPHAPAGKALGYPELFQVLEGSLTMEEARERIIRAIVQFARRQMTWFRRQRGVAWLDEPDPGQLQTLFREQSAP